MQFVTKSDHEFSPESDAEEDDEDYEPVRRARTARHGIFVFLSFSLASIIIILCFTIPLPNSDRLV